MFYFIHFYVENHNCCLLMYKESIKTKLQIIHHFLFWLKCEWQYLEMFVSNLTPSQDLQSDRAEKWIVTTFWFCYFCHQSEKKKTRRQDWALGLLCGLFHVTFFLSNVGSLCGMSVFWIEDKNFKLDRCNKLWCRIRQCETFITVWALSTWSWWGSVRTKPERQTVSSETFQLKWVWCRRQSWFVSTCTF